jgi:hypothetical protein
MSDSMPARLAVTQWQPGHRRRWCGSRGSACRFCCQLSQVRDDGSDGLDDGAPLDGAPLDGAPLDGAPLDGSPAVDVPDAVGVGSLPAGEDDCVGGTYDGVGGADAEELAGVGVGVSVGVLVGGATGQVGTFVLV